MAVEIEATPPLCLNNSFYYDLVHSSCEFMLRPMTLRFDNPIGLATNPFLILLIASKARPLSIKQCTPLTGSSSSRKTSLIQCKICIQKLLSFCKLGKFKISYFLSSSYRLILMISFNDICNLNIFWWCLLQASENLFIYAPQLFWPFFLLIRTFPHFFFPVSTLSIVYIFHQHCY